MYVFIHAIIVNYVCVFQPLFLYMAYQAPHMPLEAPQDYIDMYAADIADPNRQIYAGKWVTRGILTKEVKLSSAKPAYI